jgi:UDP-3-O-[3-hydroxymyristoyl] glucosamine N-acyltransferase
VQIAHNVKLGRGCVVVAQVGIAGSTKIGDYCVIGGQVGISGHLEIASQTQIAGGSGVIQNILEPASVVGGYPAVAIRDWHKQSVYLKKLIKK